MPEAETLDASRPGRWLKRPATYLFMFLAATAWGLVVLPYLVKRPAAEVVANDNFRTWMFLVAVQAMIWMVAVAYVWRSRADLAPEITWRVGLGPAALFAFLLILPALINKPPFKLGPFAAYSNEQPGAAPALPVNVLLGLAALVVLCWGIMAVQRTALMEREGKPASAAKIKRYLACQGHLKRYLELAGVLVAAAIVGTFAHAKSVLEIDRIKTLSEARIFHWALFSSALLSVAYIAAKSNLLAWGHTIRDELCPWPISQEQDWKGWHENRSALGELLMLESSPVADIQVVIGLLSPLVASQLSRLL